MTPAVRSMFGWFLALGAAVPGQAATLGGLVTRSDDGAPVVGASVLALQPGSFQIVAFGVTGATGSYSLNLPAGAYLLSVARADLIAELFDDVPCTADTCDIDAATPIVLAAATVRTDVHFVLAPRGTISGRVTAEDTAAPLAGVTVSAASLDDTGDASAVTGADGTYTLAVTPGPRRIRTRNEDGFVDELHANVSCPAGQCDSGLATPVSAASGATVTGIDFALARGGRIGGRVLRLDGQPIADASVDVRVANAAGDVIALAQPSASGDWQVATGLAAGSYRVAAVPSTRYAPRVWNNRPCPADDPAQCDLAGGDAVVVAVGAIAGGIDFALPRTVGSLSGRITRRADGQGFEGVVVSASRTSGDVLQTTTDTLGDWRIDDLPPGSYTLQVDPPFGSPERGERWPGLQCAFPGSCPTGTPIVLAAAEERSGLDFQLAPLATLQLLLRSADSGAPMRGEFRIRMPASGVVASAAANAPAAVSVPVTDGGLVRFAGGGGECGPGGDRVCIAERFPDTPCPNFGCTLVEGGAIDLPKGGTASAELTLSAGARIAGRTTETGGTLIDALTVEVVDADNIVAGSATTIGGDYVVDGLAANTYFVRTRAPSQFINQIWDGRPCPGGTCAPATGTPIIVAPGQDAAGIDFVLERGGGLAGRVTSELNGAAVPGASVAIFDATGVRVASATTAADGHWISPVLADGSYRVTFDATGFDAELYDGLPCPDLACDPGNGTALAVAAPATVVGVDAVLTPRAGSIVRRKLFVNRCAGGCQLTRGPDDSRINRSSIIAGPRTLGGYSGSDAGFAALTGCLRTAFQRYNVEVTPVDPGNQPHFELMVGGLPAHLGLSSGVAGVAPWAGGGLIPNAIAFTFSDAMANDPFEVCWTSAHEAGHLLGLDHEILADDFMSYIGSPQKLFVDADANCGEFNPRACDFGGFTQNSFRRLGLTAGIAPQLFGDGFEPVPPGLPLRAGAATRPLACGVQSGRTTLPPAIDRVPSGPVRSATDARRP